MAINPQQLQQLLIGSEEEKVEYLRSLLNYPIKLQDPKGSQFWFLRPGDTETCPIAVGFSWELDSLDTQNLKKWLTEDEQDRNIRGHYINSLIPDQPVLYLLLPHSPRGKVGFILPCEGKLRQRNIQIFPWGSKELLTQLERLHHNTLTLLKKIENNLLGFIPQIDWIFYPPSQTAQELAQALAVVTRRIEEAIPEVYHRETKDGYLHKLLDSFQKELLPNLQLKSDNDKDYSFADIYAQTIAYGLFTARVFSFVKDPQDFNSDYAWQQLPETNPFLKKLFQDISQQSPTELGEELIDAISETFGILRAAKMEEILVDFRNKMNQEDIVIRFYEDFLAAYKPTMREKRGVYYTPEPVVSYMVRSVDELLKDKFNKPLGLADPEVMILDPACGTGTFLLWIFRLIHQRFQENPEVLTQGLEDQSWNSYVSNRLLPRVFGFELLMAPYAICHLKLGLFLEETGYQFDSGKRLGVYLLNTLEDIKLREEKDQFTLDLPQMEELIATEAKEGSRIKKNEPIMVVIGNPPYSVNSDNKGHWITNLVRDSYYPSDKIKESNPKLLLDDYVKFICFSQWKIHQSQQGIIAIISNHSFIDNATFRKMRYKLIEEFNQIYVYNLNGNIKKRIENKNDENIFDIQQGVSITLAVKSNMISRVTYYSNLHGKRNLKYKILETTNIITTQWSEIKPKSLFFFLVPKDEQHLQEYNNFFSIKEIMVSNSMAIKTNRDHFLINFQKQSLVDKINLLIDSQKTVVEVNNLLNLEDGRYWDTNREREKIRNVKWISNIIPCLYRPFDVRWLMYQQNLIEIGRGGSAIKIMKNMLYGQNIGLICSRQQSSNNQWNLCYISQEVTECCSISNKTKESSYFFPLYLYPDPNKTQELQQEKRPNFSPDFLKTVETKLGYLPTPEEIFYYIYAIFHSPTYRIRYAEFLKIDFPRVPLTTDNKLFTQLSGYGEQLAQLHLMESPLLNNLITQFTEVGNREVIAGHPKYQKGNVYLNKTDYFTGVPEAVWNFYVGGYQVCQKWLKDRKGRTLSDEDILHYQKIVVALQETIKLMELIDQAIPGFPIT